MSDANVKHTLQILSMSDISQGGDKVRSKYVKKKHHYFHKIKHEKSIETIRPDGVAVQDPKFRLDCSLW